MDGKWSKSEAHLSRYVIAKVKFERLHYGYLHGGCCGYRGNATASLKSAYYVYDHQRHLLTTTSLQIGIVPQLLCYSVYSKGAVLHFLCCMRVIRSSHNATLKARPSPRPGAGLN